MKKLVIILMLLTFTVAGVGCYGTGDCSHGVCNEEHSKSVGPPSEDAPQRKLPLQSRNLKNNFHPIGFQKIPPLCLRRGYFVFWRSLRILFPPSCLRRPLYF